MSEGRNNSQPSQRQRHRPKRQPPDIITPIDVPWIYESIKPSNYHLLPRTVYQKLKTLQQLKAHDLIGVSFEQGPNQQQELTSMKTAVLNQEQMIRTLCETKQNKEQSAIEMQSEQAQPNQHEVFFGLNDLNINAFRQQQKNSDFQSLMEPHQENQNRALYTDADQFFLLP